MRIFLILLLLASPVFADASLDDLMTKLESRYENLKTMEAHFTQSYQSKRFADQITEKGIVYFQRGGLMKWDYQQPEQKLFISDGTHYYYYVPQDKQVIKAPAEQGNDQHSPALFLAGRGNFLHDFKAEWADPRSGSHSVKLTPIRPQPDFKYLVVEVDPVQGYIQRLLIVDQYDNRTEFAFQQIQENPSLPSNFFAFQPPPGTDVIYQHGESN
ncbi:MAG: outer membrane lipoprotein carrier protein LolA [Acidobacteria bacterium]|nr:MAG: outer membrane lipoprotein carrier protein LolA [Acidobacteriota bacterium]